MESWKDNKLFFLLEEAERIYKVTDINFSTLTLEASETDLSKMMRNKKSPNFLSILMEN